ncbi:MAG: hypothetical protein IJ865_10015 [Clostridia bacterium]|nr:hypothetical protein [Clostridia bacterium]
MASTVYQTDKRSGSMYAYLMESVRDPATGKSKPKRTYIGRVDPITKEIIQKAPPGKKNRSGITQKQVDNINHETKEKLETMRSQIETLQSEVEQLREEKQETDRLLNHIVESIAQIQAKN